MAINAYSDTFATPTENCDPHIIFCGYFDKSFSNSSFAFSKWPGFYIVLDVVSQWPFLFNDLPRNGTSLPYLTGGIAALYIRGGVLMKKAVLFLAVLLLSSCSEASSSSFPASIGNGSASSDKTSEEVHVAFHDLTISKRAIEMGHTFLYDDMIVPYVDEEDYDFEKMIPGDCISISFEGTIYFRETYPKTADLADATIKGVDVFYSRIEAFVYRNEGLGNEGCRRLGGRNHALRHHPRLLLLQ